MQKSTETVAFEKAVQPVLRFLIPNSQTHFDNFPVDSKLQDRIDELAAKSNEGALTPNERAEYESYVRANKFIAILRRQARALESA